MPVGAAAESMTLVFPQPAFRDGRGWIPDARPVVTGKRAASMPSCSVRRIGRPSRWACIRSQARWRSPGEAGGVLSCGRSWVLLG